jgi:peptidoglycan pentaglycine glycine transferase (the first glycine)
MTHLLQSSYWKEVKKNLGNKVYDFNGGWFQTTKLPFLNKYVGYVPRIDLHAGLNYESLYAEAKKANCIFVSIEPMNVQENYRLDQPVDNIMFAKGVPVQMQHNVILDLSQSEEELLSKMKQKHRYNIKLAEKNGVKVEISDSKESLDTFLALHEETVQRQKYNDRSSSYIKTVWETLNKPSAFSLQPSNNEQLAISNEQSSSKDQVTSDKSIEEQANELTSQQSNKLETKVAIAYYENEPISAWMLIGHNEILYYPYGGSSDKHRNVMATYLLVWEIIKWAKANGYKYFDLMGVLEDKSDGYSRFKTGFGGSEIKYMDTIDMVIDPLLYKVFKTLSFLRK